MRIRWARPMYCDENKIYERRAITPDRLGHALDSLDDFRGLVIVDDFVGTGAQAPGGIVALLEPHVPVLRDREVKLIFGWVSGFVDAARTVRDATTSIGIELQTYIGIPLGSTDRCFHPDAGIFETAADRERAREIAFNRGRELEKQHPLGYGACECLVVFEDGCPNNTLPILSYGRKVMAGSPCFRGTNVSGLSEGLPCKHAAPNGRWRAVLRS